MRCPKCNQDSFGRSRRRGLLEMRILPLFGFFPWRCHTCDKRVWLRLCRSSSNLGERPREESAEYQHGDHD
jgi:hypothetical protein